MNRTLSAAAVALLTLTACNSADTADAEPAPSIEPAEPSPTVKVAAEAEEWPLELNPDGHKIYVLFQWVPDVEDQQPVKARYFMRNTATDDHYAYVTPVLGDDTMPSVDSGAYEEYIYEVPNGELVSGHAYVKTSAEGFAACLVYEAKQQVILDYQESEPGEEDVSCYGFTDDEHDYAPGAPPDDLIY